MYVNTSKFPSVTTILRPFIDTAWFTDESRRRGSAVHQSASSYLNGTWAPELPEQWQGYWISLRRWIDDNVQSIEMVERRLEDSAFGYSGRPDLSAILRNDTDPALIDWKTGLSKELWHRLQTAAYKHLAKADAGVDCRRRLIIHPKPDGSGCLVDEHDKESGRDMTIFVSALNCHRFFNQKKGE